MLGDDLNRKNQEIESKYLELQKEYNIILNENEGLQIREKEAVLKIQDLQHTF